jgi:hypothetical protein
MVVENDEKITQRINPTKKPIEADAYYTVAEITDRRSPWYIASASTIFRALRTGALVGYYPDNRKRVLLSGSAIHDFIRGGQTT